MGPGFFSPEYNAILAKAFLWFGFNGAGLLQPGILEHVFDCVLF